MSLENKKEWYSRQFTWTIRGKRDGFRIKSEKFYIYIIFVVWIFWNQIKESEKYLKAEYEKLDTETLLIRAEELRKPFEGFPYCNIKAGRPLR